MADDFYRIALRPDGELLAGGRAEGVCGGQQHGGALVGQAVCQFANRGGLARAVDTGDHDDRGQLRAEDERFFQGREQLGQTVNEQGFELCRRFSLGVFGLAAQIGNQGLRGGDTGVGHQQGAFQVFKQRLVNARAAKYG